MFGLFRKRKLEEDLNASRIVPRIKHTNFLKALQEIGTGADDTPITEPLVADLLVAYAFDLPDMFGMVRPIDCKRLGIAEDQLRSLAVANLKSQLKTASLEGKQPLLRAVTGNDLEACLLLVDTFWKGLSTAIPPEIVVGVPVRDALLITSSDSKQGLWLIREMVTRMHEEEQTHNLTQHLLVRRGDRCEVFDGPP